MASGSSDELPIPLWIVVWCGFVAVALFVPTHYIRQFVVDPMTAPLLKVGDRAPEDLESMRVALTLFMRGAAVAFAVLYLLLRVLLSSWRRKGEDLP